MRSLVLLALLALVAAPFAGCIDFESVTLAEDDVLTSDPLERVLEILDPAHDHTDPDAHAEDWNLALLAYAPLSDGPGNRGAPLTYGELDIVGDLAVVAILQPVGGFVTVDVSEPAEPKVLGYHWAGAAYAGDVKLSPDGRYAFLALNGGYAWDEVQKNPALIPTYARGVGVEVVDVSDPASPRSVAFHPLAMGGAHMLDVHVLGGETYVFSVVYSRPRLPAALPVEDSGYSSRIEIARLGTTATGGIALTHVADYIPPTAMRGPVGLHAPHDVTIVQDPELGPLLLAAYGRAGVAVASLADPANPRHLGHWTGHEGQYVHTIMMDYVDGQRTLFVVPEVFSAAEQNQLWILDAEDLADIKLVGTWRLPGHLPFDGGYQFSTHNFHVLDGKLYMAHFHAGIWVLDVNDLDALRDPAVLAYAMPRETGNVGTGLGIAAAPLVWDVVPAKGYVFASDIVTGLYVYETPWEMPDAVAYGSRGL